MSRVAPVQNALLPGDHLGEPIFSAGPPRAQSSGPATSGAIATNPPKFTQRDNYWEMKSEKKKPPYTRVAHPIDAHIPIGTVTSEGCTC